MEIAIIGFIFIAFCLILKMILESKSQIDALVQELEEIQQKIEVSLSKKSQPKIHSDTHYVTNAILATGDTHSPQKPPVSPYTPANHN